MEIGQRPGDRVERQGDAEWHGEVATAAEQPWAVPHSHVLDKNHEGYCGSNGYLGSE